MLMGVLRNPAARRFREFLPVLGSFDGPLTKSLLDWALHRKVERETYSVLYRCEPGLPNATRIRGRGSEREVKASLNAFAHRFFDP